MIRKARGCLEKLHWNNNGKKEQLEEGAAAAKQISKDAAVAALLSEPCGVFTVKVGRKQHHCLYILLWSSLALATVPLETLMCRS